MEVPEFFLVKAEHAQEIEAFLGGLGQRKFRKVPVRKPGWAPFQLSELAKVHLWQCLVDSSKLEALVRRGALEDVGTFESRHNFRALMLPKVYLAAGYPTLFREVAEMTVQSMWNTRVLAAAGDYEKTHALPDMESTQLALERAVRRLMAALQRDGVLAFEGKDGSAVVWPHYARVARNPGTASRPDMQSVDAVFAELPGMRDVSVTRMMRDAEAAIEAVAVTDGPGIERAAAVYIEAMEAIGTRVRTKLGPAQSAPADPFADDEAAPAPPDIMVIALSDIGTLVPTMRRAASPLVDPLSPESSVHGGSTCSLSSSSPPSPVVAKVEITMTMPSTAGALLPDVGGIVDSGMPDVDRLITDPVDETVDTAADTATATTEAAVDVTDDLLDFGATTTTTVARPIGGTMRDLIQLDVPSTAGAYDDMAKSVEKMGSVPGTGAEFTAPAAKPYASLLRLTDEISDHAMFADSPALQTKLAALRKQLSSA